MRPKGKKGVKRGSRYTCDAPRADDEREREEGDRPEGLCRKEKGNEQTAKGRCFRCDRCSATPSCRHPWTFAHSPPFRTSPSRAEKQPLFIPPSSSPSRCLAPTKPSMSRLLQFSRLSTDARGETRIDDPRVVSIKKYECICIARGIIITESVYIAKEEICLSASSWINSANFFKRSPSFSAGMHYMNKNQRWNHAECARDLIHATSRWDLSEVQSIRLNLSPCLFLHVNIILVCF